MLGAPPVPPEPTGLDPPVDNRALFILEEAGIRREGPSFSMKDQSPIHPRLNKTYHNITGVYPRSDRARSRALSRHVTKALACAGGFQRLKGTCGL